MWVMAWPPWYEEIHIPIQAWKSRGCLFHLRKSQWNAVGIQGQLGEETW